VYGLTSTNPEPSVIPESTSSACGLEVGLMLAWKNGFSITSEVSTFLKVAIFSP
jgi:hypothetical protein